MEITIDEWLIYYISDQEKAGIAYGFLEKVFKKCDRFVALKNGKLDKKVFWLSKQSGQWEPKRRIVAKYFFNNFFMNSEKYFRIDESEPPEMPENIARLVPEDDVYLIRTALKTEEKLVLTSDLRLREKLSKISDIKILLVDEFLSDY
jgi:hypothetical protein